MKLCLTCLLALCVTSRVKETRAYQVAHDTKNVFKNAIEKTTKVAVPPLEVQDDETFSPDIPWAFIPSNAEENESPILLKDGPVTSESLRTAYQVRQVNQSSNAVALPLHKSFPSRVFPPSRNASSRKRFFLDENPTEYWFDNRIHTFGNTGLFGGFHAAMAPMATKIIDDAAYKGMDVREMVSKDLNKVVSKNKACVLDLCCGVGMSTRALGAAFKDAQLVVGVDTSPEMIAMARAICKHDIALSSFRSTSTGKKLVKFCKRLPSKMLAMFKEISLTKFQPGTNVLYARGNAERVKFPDSSFDLVTIMYAFHEIPKTARYRILREARRLLKDGGTLAIVDISPEYQPSPTMLAGEPYVLEYKKNIRRQMRLVQGFGDFQYKSIVPGHVCSWFLTRQRAEKTSA